MVSAHWLTLAETGGSLSILLQQGDLFDWSMPFRKPYGDSPASGTCFCVGAQVVIVMDKLPKSRLGQPEECLMRGCGCASA